LNPKISIW
ncbi:putative NUDIX hydrolase, partial [Vibrio parahaemolyticus VP2007-007]